MTVDVWGRNKIRIILGGGTTDWDELAVGLVLPRSVANELYHRLADLLMEIGELRIHEKPTP